MIRRALVVAVLVVAGCRASGAAGPPDEPTSLRRLAVAYVEDGSPELVDQIACCPSGIRATAGHVSKPTADGRWATVQVRSTTDGGEPEPLTVVLRRGRVGWAVLRDPSCGLPVEIRRAVGLDGLQPCTPLPTEPDPSVPRTTEVGEADGVRAAITYADVDLGYGNAIVHLRIDRRGRAVVRTVVEPVREDLWGTDPSAVQVVDLDDDGEPEVVLDLFWGGAHCCTWSEIYRWDAEAKRYDRARYLWGNNDYDLRDLDDDGRPELVTLDDRFAYAFASFAGSAFPVQVLHYERGRMIDVTRRYPDLVRADATHVWQWYEESKAGGDEGRGGLAAWVADQCLLDRCQRAQDVVHREAPTPTTSTTNWGDPYGSWATFEHNLRTELTGFGYLRRTSRVHG